MRANVVLRNDGDVEVRVTHVARPSALGLPSEDHVVETRVLKNGEELAFWFGKYDYLEVKEY